MLKRYLVLGLLLSLAGSAFASDMKDLAAIDRALNALFDLTSGVASKSPLLEDGRRLFGYLLVILIAWSGIQVLLEGGAFAAVVGKLVEVTLVAGICSFLMMSTTQQALVKTFDVAAGKIATATNSGAPDLSNPAGAIKQILGSGFTSVQNLWASKPETEDKQPWYRFDLKDGIADVVLALLMESIAKLGISVVILICLGLYVYIVINAMLLISVALMLAPVMLPFMLWPSTAFLAQSWIRFVIVCGMNKILAALFLGITFYFLDAIGTLALTAAASPTFDSLAYFSALVLSVIIALAMAQVPRISADLVSGLPALSLHMPKPSGGGGQQRNTAPAAPSNSAPPGGGGGGGGRPPAAPRPPSGVAPIAATRSAPRVNLLK